MDLRRLRYFLAVAEELHFARAAARLGIEQSPLSRQIQELEDRLQVRLFERSRRSTRLTAAGEQFVLDARRILADVELSVSALKVAAKGRQPLRLGLSESIGGTPFSRLLKLCRTPESPCTILLTEAPTPDLLRLLSGGGLDAALTPTQLEAPDICSSVAWTERFVALVPRGVAEESTAIWLKDLSSQRLILPDPATFPGCALQLEALLKERGMENAARKTASTTARLTHLVEAGYGNGLLPSSLIVLSSEVVVRPLKDVSAQLVSWLSARRGDQSYGPDALRRIVEVAAGRSAG